jgi:uncharacterized protein (UPF0276 family)
MAFAERARSLPWLGLGVSTEYGAGNTPGALDPMELRARVPLGFLEVGVETAKGLDDHAAAWIQAGLATTYHFLDLNLDEPEDLDDRWLSELDALLARMRPAWLCGDAGLWHFGARDRGHMLLLPPVLTDDSARAMADGIRALRAHTGREVIPENPPGAFYLGDLHLLDFYARLADYADTGVLLDLAHLAIYQRTRGGSPTDGLDGFPLDQIVEMHVAGGRALDTPDGFAFVDDDHSLGVLDEVWPLLERIAPNAPNLKAVVLECERNPLDAVLPLFDRIAAVVAR